MPSEPPTMRFIDRIPDAIPAFAFATAFIAAVDIGDITSAIPRPISTNEGQKLANVELASSVVSQPSETVTSASPATIGSLAPMRSVSRPARGAKATIIRVAGRNLTPAWRGE